MEINKRDVGWKLWVQWVLANILGIAFATIDFYDMGEDPISRAVMWTYGIILYGFFIGIVQWIVLFRFNISVWWIPATGISIIVFSLLYLPVSLFGAAVLQTPILWRRVRWSGLWILAHLPAYLLIVGKYRTLYDVLSPWLSSSISETEFIILAGIINSVITGFVLIWLLRHQKMETLATK